MIEILKSASVIGALSLLLLAACGGGGPPDQSQAPRNELTGMMTDGAGGDQRTATANGAAGIPRNGIARNGLYTLGLSQLTAPYILINTPSPFGDPGFVVMTSLATKSGRANITPLTTLLTSQLLGLDPANAYLSFTETSTPTHLITEANIDAAQAQVTAFLRDVYGVPVHSGTASFIESAFNPVAGDPMFDTILALNAKLVQKGTTLGALATQIANVSRACRAERIGITIGGSETDFCPRLKKVSPNAGDGTILDYVFTTIANDVLTVQVRVNNVVGVTYAGGGNTYSCAASACGNVVLGTPAPDQSRAITFASTALTGSAGSVALSGTLLGGNFPPLLNCLDNRFFVTLPDTSIVADCVDTDTNPIIFPGTISEAAGFNRDRYRIRNDGTTPEPQLPSSPEVEVVLDSNSSVVSIWYKDRDPNNGVIANSFVCQLSTCNGVTLGPITVRDAQGFSFPVRTITMTNTQLSGLNANGTPTGTTAKLDASFTAIYYRDPPGSYPQSAACDPGTVAIAMVAPGAAFNTCFTEPLLIEDLGGGETKIFFQDFNTQVEIDLRLLNGAPASVNVYISGSAETFACSTDCVGIAVSPPDANGAVTVTFNNTLLHQLQSFPLPGSRTLTLTGGPIVASPPQPAVCNPATEDTVVANVDGNPINMCFAPPGIIYDAGNGDTEPFFQSPAGDSIDVFILNGGNISYIFVYVASIGRSFMCVETACTGLAISPPDGLGQYTLTFNGTVLPGLDDPAQTLTLTGSAVALPQ